MQALILAAGLGTRLKPLTIDTHKVMLPINKLQQPFLLLLINKLKQQGINDFVIATSYLHDQIANYFQDGKKFGVHIKYSRTKKIMGTAGTIVAAAKFLNKTFFVFNGDSYSKINYLDMLQLHYENKNDVTISLIKKNDAGRYGLVKFVYDRITEFSEKNNNQKIGYINSGVYLFNKEILKFIPEKIECSLEKEILPKLLKRKKIGGFCFNDYFIDMGVKEDFIKIKNDIINKKI